MKTGQSHSFAVSNLRSMSARKRKRQQVKTEKTEEEEEAMPGLEPEFDDALARDTASAVTAALQDELAQLRQQCEEERAQLAQLRVRCEEENQRLAELELEQTKTKPKKAKKFEVKPVKMEHAKRKPNATPPRARSTVQYLPSLTSLARSECRHQLDRESVMELGAAVATAFVTKYHRRPTQKTMTIDNKKVKVNVYAQRNRKWLLKEIKTWIAKKKNTAA